MFSDHTPMVGVGAVLHDGEIGGVVVPLLEDLDAADCQGWVDGDRFGDVPAESGCGGAVLRRGSVGSGVAV